MREMDELRLVHVHTIWFYIMGGFLWLKWKRRALLYRGLPYLCLAAVSVEEAWQRRSLRRVEGRLWVSCWRHDRRPRPPRRVHVLWYAQSRVLVGRADKCWTFCYDFRNAILCRQAAGAIDGMRKQLGFPRATTITSRLIRCLTAGRKWIGLYISRGTLYD